MSAAPDQESSGSRLLTFEVMGSLYALPISEVLEVVEGCDVACIPALPRSEGGVMNWHGEALPIVAPHLLLGGEEHWGTRSAVDQQFLVVTNRAGESARFGLPIDCVAGLVDGEPGHGRNTEVVVERRPLDGRVVNVVNPRRLVARAVEVIESAVA